MRTRRGAAAGRRGMPGRGFTLIEVVIAMAIVAILTAIALPSYTEYVRRSHRNDARAALLQAQQFMERYRTQFGSYDDGANPPALPAALAQSPGLNSGTKQYDVTIAARTAVAYRLEAAPASGGMMLSDSCGTLQLFNDGRRDRTGAASLSTCWTR